MTANRLTQVDERVLNLPRKYIFLFCTVLDYEVGFCSSPRKSDRNTTFADLQKLCLRQNLLTDCEWVAKLSNATGKICTLSETQTLHFLVLTKTLACSYSSAHCAVAAIQHLSLQDNQLQEVGYLVTAEDCLQWSATTAPGTVKPYIKLKL